MPVQYLALGALVSVAVLLKIRHAGRRKKNWSGTVTFSQQSLHHPTSVKELQHILRSSTSVKVVGSAHSFSRVADTHGDLVVLDKLEVGPPSLDDKTGVLTVPSTFTYGAVVSFLEGKAWALHNLASLPHITVGGSIATGTHGSGMNNGNLSTAVCGLDMVTPAGEILTITRDTHPKDFPGYVVGLGALGVVIRVHLTLVPTFTLAQYIYEGLPLSTVVGNFREIMGAAGGYSVSLFTTWKTEVFEQVWRKVECGGGRDVEEGGSRSLAAGAAGATPFPPTWFGATLAPTARHPIPGVSGETCTVQGGVPGHAHHRLPHFRMEFTPSAGEELQSEYFVAVGNIGGALAAVSALRDRIAPLLYISEVRTMRGDDLWLSMAASGGAADGDAGFTPRVAIHFTWRPLEAQVLAFLPHLEAALAPFHARPHWGKVFTMNLLEAGPRLYGKGWEEFKALQRRVDPKGKFVNPFLRQHFGF